MLKPRVVAWSGSSLVCLAVLFGTTRELITSPNVSHEIQASVSPAPLWADHVAQPVPIKGRAPAMRCEAALVIDNTAEEVLYCQNALARRPIASLTKLLTALVFLESGVSLDSVVQLTKEDAWESSRSRLHPGDKLLLHDYLYAALVSSDNRAARVLARSAGMAPEAFIARMNDRAHALGMDSTRIIEPTGLSQENVSTARDCALLLNAALKNPLIREITTTPETTVQCVNRRRLYHLVNTNRLLRSGFQFVGGKTGYIDAAGWCIVARSAAPDGRDVTVVVLGAPSNSNRFRSLRNALSWVQTLPRSQGAGS